MGDLKSGKKLPDTEFKEGVMTDRVNETPGSKAGVATSSILSVWWQLPYPRDEETVTCSTTSACCLLSRVSKSQGKELAALTPPFVNVSELYSAQQIHFEQIKRTRN